MGLFRYSTPLFAVILLVGLTLNPGHTNRSLASAGSTPYDFKGDTLGMSLNKFKAKHHRVVSEARKAPNCSDTNPDGKGIANQRDYLINCTLYFPVEWPPPEGSIRWQIRSSGDFDEIEPLYVTIAGEPIISPYKSPVGYGRVYRFVEDNGEHRLWTIEILVPKSSFHPVREALTVKYGEAGQKIVTSLHTILGLSFTGEHLSWKDKKSSINLIEYYESKDYSGVIYSHRYLSKIVEKLESKRTRKKAKDL